MQTCAPWRYLLSNQNLNCFGKRTSAQLNARHEDLVAVTQLEARVAAADLEKCRQEIEQGRGREEALESQVRLGVPRLHEVGDNLATQFGHGRRGLQGRRPDANLTGSGGKSHPKLTPQSTSFRRPGGAYKRF